MTNLVKSLKIGNNSYSIQDATTLSALTAAQRTTLLSNGTYLGNPVETGKIFETDSGKFEQFSDTVTGATLSNTVSSVDLQVNGWASGASNRGGYIFNREHDIILKYTNGSWQEVSHAFTLDYLVVPQDTVDIFAVDTSGVLYHSTEDSPSTWETLTTLSNYEIDTAFYAEKIDNDGFYYITWYGSGGYVYLARYPISGGTLTQIYSNTGWGTAAKWPFFVYSEGKLALYPGGYSIPGGPLFTSPKNSSSWSSLVWQGNSYYKNLRSVTKVGTTYYFCDVNNSQILSTSTPTVSGSYTVVNIASLSGSSNAPFLLANYQNALLAVPCFSTGDLYYSTNATSPSFTKYADISGMTKNAAYVCTFAGDRLFIGSYSDSTIYSIDVTANHDYSLTPLSYTKSEVDSKGYLQNTATGTNSLTIGSTYPATVTAATNIGIASQPSNYGIALGGSSKAPPYGIAIGTIAQAGSSTIGSVLVGYYAKAASNCQQSVAIGYYAEQNSGSYGIAIGSRASSNANSAYMIGCARNSDANTLKVTFNRDPDNQPTDESGGLYTLLDSSGKIPAARLSNIYEIVQTMPASPTAGKIYFVTGA